MSPTIKKSAAKEKTVDVGTLFEKYFAALRKIPLDEKTEHTDRAALQHLLQTLATNVNASGKRKLIVRDHLLKNIFGFEYLIAPYTIAHLKLSQYLREQKYELSDDERFQVCMTNTLEPM